MTTSYRKRKLLRRKSQRKRLRTAQRAILKRKILSRLRNLRKKMRKNMKVSVKDCLQLEAFRKCIVVAGEKHMDRRVKAVSVMDAATAPVSEKLSNIKTAYEEHGGGISGVAAAAMEAVKGWYTAGYTFIDNLTGGKLSEIREKFSTAMSNIVQGISQKFTDARTAFSNGLNNIKNAVSGAVTWFFESGKRIVSTFANGIKSAFSSAVEAVKGGLQKIRNLLPFSDAKEGPLSTLTLSGQRTMTTYAHGLTLAGDAPAEAMNKSLQQVQGALDRKPEKKVDLGGGKKDKDESSDEGSSGKGKQVIIHKLLVPVDLKKIKDLQQLLALLQEVEDYAAANEDGEPGDDEDAAPAPA